jgi:hypothetical protein
MAPTPPDGECRVSIVDPPLLTGAIGWALLANWRQHQRRPCADSSRWPEDDRSAQVDPLQTFITPPPGGPLRREADYQVLCGLGGNDLRLKGRAAVARLAIVRREEPSVPGQPVERKLAAIFAADIAGYSRLMAADEAGTVARLKASRMIVDRLIAAHRGRIFNTAGDSVVADFASAVDALGCAVAVQDALAMEPPHATAEQMQFRIGIHVGDVIVDGGDLLGDGVNIARPAGGAGRAGQHLHLGHRARTCRQQASSTIVVLSRGLPALDTPCS